MLKNTVSPDWYFSHRLFGTSPMQGIVSQPDDGARDNRLTPWRSTWRGWRVGILGLPSSSRQLCNSIQIGSLTRMGDAPQKFAAWMSTHVANDKKFGRKVF